MSKTKTSWKLGQSGNPNGRPPLGNSIVEKFRNDKRSEKVIDKLFQVALTLGTKKEHRQAMTCAKLIMDKLIPSIKEIEIDTQTEVLNAMKHMFYENDQKAMEAVALAMSKLYDEKVKAE